MQLIDTQKRIIESIINDFETSSAERDYSKISIYAGPHQVPVNASGVQVT